MTDSLVKIRDLDHRIADLYRSMRSRRRADIARRPENEAIVASLIRERAELRAEWQAARRAPIEIYGSNAA